MVHSNKTICALLMIGAAICGCSQHDDLDVNGIKGAETQGEAGVVFRLQTNGPSVTRSAEDSYEHVQGTPDEYKVEKARVYFFDTPTKLFVKSVTITNLTRSGSNTTGDIIYESEHVSVPQGTYDIFVVANSDRKINKNTEAEFLADIDSATYAQGLISDISGGVVMTNRAPDNLSTVIASKSPNEDVVVRIRLERVLARIDIAKSRESFELTDSKGKKYADVTLDKHYIVNLAKHYYSYRHTAVLNSLDVPQWSLDENFGDVKDVNGYVIDPYFFSKSPDASTFRNADKYYEHFFGDYSNPQAITWTAFKPVSETPQYCTTYCPENCTLTPAQKNGYSTGVIFSAKVEPYNNVYHLSNGQLELVNDRNRYPDVLYYFAYNFYDSAEALAKAIGVSSVSATSLDIYQAKKFEKGDDGCYRCYYNYWIRHLDNYKPTIMGVMEFAVVRNNLYRMLITNVSDLGYAEVPVDPDLPDEGEAFLKVVLNVKPWIVRDLTNIVL